MKRTPSSMMQMMEEKNDECESNLIDTDHRVRYSVTKGNIKIVLRTKPKIIRYVKYSQKVDPENYFREQLMLFFPWRNEEVDLLNGHKTYEDHFKAVSQKIESTRQEYDASLELLTQIEVAADTQSIEHFDDVSPNIESVEASDALQEPMQATKYAFYNPKTSDHTYYDLGADIGLATHISNDDIEMIQNRLPENDYLELLSKLNKK